MKFRQFFTAMAFSASLLAPALASAQTTMLTEINSPHAFKETVERIEKTLGAKGLTVFAKIDHSAAATGAGLTLRPTTVIIFGNPKGGTPVMVANPTAAIDLPLKALVWQGDDGKVKVAVNSAELYRRHGVAAEPATALGGVAALMEAALK